MVLLDRIYTKSGDKGKTSLGNGQRVLKSDPRLHTIGEIDELNASLGLACLFATDGMMAILLQKIQNDLFDLGADLCMPETKTIQVTKDYITRLEHLIDNYNKNLEPLKSFVLPGGTTLASHLHVSRTICRRAERSLVALMQEDNLNPYLLSYINRLSDLLFVLARFANQGNDILWEPQKWKMT